MNWSNWWIGCWDVYFKGNRLLDLKVYYMNDPSEQIIRCFLQITCVPIEQSVVKLSMSKR